jgi:hypothetical protein
MQYRYGYIKFKDKVDGMNMFKLQLQYPHVLAIHPIFFLFNARCTYIIYGS